MPAGAKRACKRRMNLSAKVRFVGPTAAVFHSSDFEVVDRDESRLAAHRQANVVADEIGIDLFRQARRASPRLTPKKAA